MITPLHPGRFTGLLLLLPAVALADSSSPAWSVRGWQLQLKEKTVVGITPMPDGHLWLAAPTHLVRFDGVSFEEFGLKRVLGRSLAPSKLRKSLPSRSGGLWLGVDTGGVIHFKDGRSHFILDELPRSAPRTLVEDAEGALWLSCNNGHVYRIADGKPTPVPPGERISGKEPAELARDGQGQMWFVKGDKGGVIQDGRLEMRFSLPEPENCITGSRAGGAWICSGFNLFKAGPDGRLTNCGKPDPEHVNSRPIVLLEDEDGKVWIGTSFGGLFCYDGQRFQNVPTSHPKVLSLARDREGNIWAGTTEGGLLRVQPGVVRLEGADIAAPLQTFRSLCEDTSGTLWAVNGNGSLLVRQDNAWKPCPVSIPGRVTCVAADRDGGVWIGGHYRKLFHLRDGKLTTLGREHGLNALRIRILLTDGKGDLWIAMEQHDGLKRLHDGKIEDIALPSNIRDISALAEDSSGDIWIGTGDGDLLRVSSGNVVNEGDRAETPRTWIRSLRATGDGLWICYRDRGVGRLRNGIFTMVTPAQGLHEASINELIFDAGWAWFSGEHGIFKVRQQELEAVAAGRRARVQSVYYGVGQNSADPQVLLGTSFGALRGRDGRLWMPMLGAVAIIDPGSARADLEPPRVVVKQVRVNDTHAGRFGGFVPERDVPDLAGKVTLQLPPQHRYVEFDFIALSFAAPQNVRFQYCLGGFDDHWVDAGTLRRATYSRLPAGDYRFQVKACNSSGIWNETGAALAFTVAPFYWQSWWFRTGALAVFTLLIVALVRYVSFRRLRLRVQLLEQQAALEKERTRIARDLHDDLGSRLTKIILLNELTLQRRTRPDQVGGQMQQSLAMARQMIRSLDETVWAVNPRNDTLPHLVAYLGEFAVEFLQTAGIRCRVDLPHNLPSRTVSSEVRHNVLLAVKEALNNIVRHAQANEVSLGAVITDEALRLTIADNGRGFASAPDDAFADGLRNMRQRMDLIGGQFQVESSPGAGTKVALICPWQK